MELSYEKARRIAGTWLPQRLRVTIARGKTDVQLDYRDIELNPTTLTKGAFQVDCPAGTKVQDLGCSEDAP